MSEYDVAAHNVKVEYTVDGTKYHCIEKLTTIVEKLGFGRRKALPPEQCSTFSLFYFPSILLTLADDD